MPPGQAPRQSHSLAYETLKEQSPWKVNVDEHAEGQVFDLVRVHPQMEGFFADRLLAALVVFPLDPKYFSDPEMSWGNPSIWVTISERHIRIRVKAEYRKEDGICWVVEVRAEPSA